MGFRGRPVDLRLIPCLASLLSRLGVLPSLHHRRLTVEALRAQGQQRACAVHGFKRALMQRLNAKPGLARPLIDVMLPIVSLARPIVSRTLPVVSLTLPVVSLTLPIVSRTLPIVSPALPLVGDTLALVGLVLSFIGPMPACRLGPLG